MNAMQTHRRRILLLVSTAALSLSSCREGTSPHLALEQARTRWAERGPSNYSVVVSRSCFCAPQSTQPVRVTVENGLVVSRLYVETGQPVPEALASSYPDVDSLFAIVAAAIGHAARVDATYQPDFGYPESVYIDYDAQAADDEISWGLGQFAEPLM